MMSSNIKSEFGKRLRTARDAKKLSRAALGVRLGISPKTIQSWEMGRTFIEDLSLIPALESELDISVSNLIARATGGGGSMAAEAPAPYGSRKKTQFRAGPTPCSFEVHAVKTGSLPSESKLAEALVSVPLVKPRSATKPVADLTPRDVVRHVVIPGEWVPRGGVLVAYRMKDSGMSPMAPLGSTLIIDRRPMTVKKALNRVVALDVHNKGMRIRRLVEEPASGKIIGATCIEGGRGEVKFREDKGDTVIGRVVGVLAQPE